VSHLGHPARVDHVDLAGELVAATEQRLRDHGDHVVGVVRRERLRVTRGELVQRAPDPVVRRRAWRSGHRSRRPRPSGRRSSLRRPRWPGTPPPHRRRRRRAGRCRGRPGGPWPVRPGALGGRPRSGLHRGRDPVDEDVLPDLFGRGVVGQLGGGLDEARKSSRRQSAAVNHPASLCGAAEVAMSQSLPGVGVDDQGGGRAVLRPSGRTCRERVPGRSDASNTRPQYPSRGWVRGSGPRPTRSRMRCRAAAEPVKRGDPAEAARPSSDARQPASDPPKICQARADFATRLSSR